eukprot:12962421-Alexandrium_andersonii.AAC.1
MSASLVGSEMCIRDRTYTDKRITGAASACSSLQRFAALCCAASLGGGATAPRATQKSTSGARRRRFLGA